MVNLTISNSVDVILLPLQIVALTNGASISSTKSWSALLTTSHSITVLPHVFTYVLTCTWKEMAQITPLGTE